MEGWIFKRTVQRFLCWVGAILLLLFGCGVFVSAATNGPPLLIILGVVLFLAGMLLAMFARSLNKWMEIKK